MHHDLGTPLDIKPSASSNSLAMPLFQTLVSIYLFILLTLRRYNFPLVKCFCSHLVKHIGEVTNLPDKVQDIPDGSRMEFFLSCLSIAHFVPVNLA